MSESKNMVRRLHVTLDDREFERVQAVKDDHGLTWEEFVIEAARALDERDESNTDDGAGAAVGAREPEGNTSTDTAPDVGAISGRSAAADSGGVIGSVLDGWRPGRTAHEREERLQAAAAALEFLRDRGDATKSEFIEALYPGQAPDDQSEDTYWRKTVRGKTQSGEDGALALAMAAGVVEREQGPPHVYRWVGGDTDQ